MSRAATLRAPRPLDPLPDSPQLRLFAGCALISFSSVFVTLSSVAPTVSAFYRVAIGGVVLLAILWRAKWPFTRAPVPYALLAGAIVFFALDLAFWHRSIEFVGPGLATLLASFQVFFMTAAGIVWFGQRPNRIQLLAIPLALFGLALVVGLDWSVLSEQYRDGVVFGLLTGLVYAGYLLCLRQAQTGGSGRLPVAELAVVSLGSAVLLAGSAFVEGRSLAIERPIDYLWLGCLAILCHVGGWLLIASSLPRVPTAIAGLLLTMQPVLTFFWDVMLFGRSFTATEVTGVALAILGVWLGARR
ncbi:MAG: DMT family transporter [Planctomycetes bacterium]|nr:DMT family transporter [Planctomycetota bacterium]